MIYLFFTDILSHFVLPSVSVKYVSNRSFSPDLTTWLYQNNKTLAAMFLFDPPKNSLEGWTLSSCKNFLLFQEIYIHSSTQWVWKWCSISVIVLVMIMTTAGVEVSFWTSYSWTTPKWYKTKTGSKETKIFFFEPVLSSQKNQLLTIALITVNLLRL